MSAVDELATRLSQIRTRVAAAAARAGRTAEEITLVGVSKRQPAELVTAAVHTGLRDIGENYVQEAIAKHALVMEQLRSSDTHTLRWHFIGQLQRNKVRHVVSCFDIVHTLDREPLGDELERRASAAGRRLDVLLQVNLCDEPQKGGITPDSLRELLAASARWQALRVTGLMAIPPATANPESGRPAFAQLRSLRDAHRDLPGGEHLHELSMGMSDDFEVAIEEGATIIRVGTAIFGPRGPR